MASTDRGGGIKIIFEFASRLALRGHSIEIVAMRRRNDPKCQNHAWFKFPENVTVRYAPFNWPAATARRFLPKLGFPTYQVQYVNRLAREIPESNVVVATSCLTAYPVESANKGAGAYHGQHYEPLLFDHPEMKKTVERAYGLPLRKIANSSWLKTKLAKYDGSIELIFPAIDHHTFRPMTSVRNSDEFRVVSLGRIIPWKGLRDLFDATLIVRQKIPELKLILYGNDPNVVAPVPYEYLSRIEDGDLAKLYSSADVVVTPSWYESFPLPPLEAMACGAAVVCTPFGTEDYAIDKQNCLIVPPRDPKRMASAIIALYNDQTMREKIGRQGIMTAQRFQWDTSVDQMERFFNSLC
jgi:glycosyltransferase involved in cell wall biosynthesis